MKIKLMNCIEKKMKRKQSIASKILFYFTFKRPSFSCTVHNAQQPHDELSKYMFCSHKRRNQTNVKMIGHMFRRLFISVCLFFFFFFLDLSSFDEALGERDCYYCIGIRAQTFYFVFLPLAQLYHCIFSSFLMYVRMGPSQHRNRFPSISHNHGIQSATHILRTRQFNSIIRRQKVRSKKESK